MILSEERRKEIQYLAEEINYHAGFGDVVDFMCHEKHVAVVYVSKGNPISHMVKNADSWTCYTSDSKFTYFYRVALAREIGHIYLHHPLKEDNSFGYFDLPRQQEGEATYFMYSVLMPHKKFMDAYYRDAEVNRLSGIFKVPNAAIYVRCWQLGLNDPKDMVFDYDYD